MLLLFSRRWRKISRKITAAHLLVAVTVAESNMLCNAFESHPFINKQTQRERERESVWVGHMCI